MSESNNQTSEDILDVLEPLVAAIKSGSIWQLGLFEFKSVQLPNGYRFSVRLQQGGAGPAREKRKSVRKREPCSDV